MVRRFTIQTLMNLAKAIGASPNKFMGTRTNITFLGKGPTKNPLFQSPIAGLETATEASLGPKESIIGAVEDAMGFASARKLNSIQTQALGLNLENILKVYRPPPLPTASVTPIASGIEGLRRFPRETHKFFGRPLKDKDFTEIDELVKRGRLPGAGIGETGTVDFGAAMIAKTGMSRAVARQILLQDTRLNLTDRAISTLKLSKDLGKGKMGSDPLDMMKLFYKPSSMRNYDEFLNAANIRPGMNAKDIATRILAEVELLPNIRYAEGGLAEVLQAPRSGYSKGRLVKGALAILNRNKKNAEYMFKASDNVSPGYARGDLKYNAELLAEQLAEDAGILYEDLGALEQTKFYGTAYDYLAAEMGKHLLQKRNFTKMARALGARQDLSAVGPAYGEKHINQLLTDWKPGRGRKPSASGGLARILEV